MKSSLPLRCDSLSISCPWPGLFAGIFSLFLLAGLTGCGGSKPKPADAEKAAKQRIAQESEGRIKVVSFKTTTPQPDGLGGETYYWSYAAEIEFAEDCRWRLDRITESANVDFRTMPPEAKPGEEASGRPMKQGQRRRVTGTVHLEKSKAGWQPALVSILTNHPVE
jgi:hypothetical protein